MSEYPNFDLLLTHPKPLSDMAYHLRDKDRSWEEIEERRKTDLREIIADWQNGKHPALVLLSALEATVGNNHPWARLPSIVRNPNYFSNHRLDKKEDEPEKTAEEKYTEYLKKAEDVIGAYFEELQESALVLSNDESQIILDELNDNGAIDAAILLTHDILSSKRYSGDEGRNGIIQSLQKQRDFEREKFSVTPYDELIPDDPMKILLSHKSRHTYAQEWTRDEYLFHHEIEIRRLGEIIKILEDWKKGAHPIHVLQDILQTGMSRFDTPYEGLFSSAQRLEASERNARADHIHRRDWTEDQRDTQLVRAFQEQESLRLNFRKEMRRFNPDIITYRDAEQNPEFAAQIDAYIQHIQESDETSLGIIRNIAETMLLPVKDIPEDIKDFQDDDDEEDVYQLLHSGRVQNFHDLSTLAKIAVRIEEAKKKEEKFIEENKPMGELKTQSEAETREPLKEIFRRRALGGAKGKKLPHLCSEIDIGPSGSGAIKPYPSSDYDGGFEERLYGTTIARITTYSVTLVPKDPESLMRLYGYAKWAMKQMARTEYDFEIPFDFDAQDFAYERPKFKSREDRKKQKNSHRRERYGRTYYESLSFSNCGVNLVDGKVQIDARLDLDDVWNLYYLLEDVIEPNRQVAEMMNNARYAEERGMLEQKGDMNIAYSNDAMRPEDQMGTVDNVAPEDYVPETMNQTLSLYALGEIDEKQLLQRVVELADSTLQGRMVDSIGAFPTYLRLTHGIASQGGELISYHDAVKERTREIMMVMTGTFDKDRPLFPALIAKVNEISRPLRDQLREKSHDERVNLWDRIDRDSDTLLFEKMFGDKDEKFDNFEDELSYIGKRHKTRNARLGATHDLLEKWKRKAEGGRSDENEDDSDKKAEQGRHLAASANIALRSPDVGLTSNRSWRGTDYVSKAKDSLWVRKELPAALAKYFKNNERPDMQTALRAITSEIVPS